MTRLSGEKFATKTYKWSFRFADREIGCSAFGAMKLRIDGQIQLNLPKILFQKSVKILQVVELILMFPIGLSALFFGNDWSGSEQDACFPQSRLNLIDDGAVLDFADVLDGFEPDYNVIMRLGERLVNYVRNCVPDFGVGMPTPGVLNRQGILIDCVDPGRDRGIEIAGEEAIPAKQIKNSTAREHVFSWKNATLQPEQVLRP